MIHTGMNGQKGRCHHHHQNNQQDNECDDEPLTVVLFVGSVRLLKTLGDVNIFLPLVFYWVRNLPDFFIRCNLGTNVLISWGHVVRVCHDVV